MSAHLFVYEEFPRFYFQIRSLKWVCVFLKWLLDPTFVFLLRRQGLCLSKVYCSLQFWEDICYIGPSIYDCAYCWYVDCYTSMAFSWQSFSYIARIFRSSEPLFITDLIARMDIVLVLYRHCAGVMVYIVLQCIAGIVIKLILYWFCTGILYSSVLQWYWSDIVLILC